jgi:hypothetical protein
MKFKRNLLILSAILIGVLIVVIGCLPTTPPAEEGDVPTNGTISVAAAAATTNDTTPTLTLSSTGATYMAFSGNGTTWSDWVAYATTYSTFNITTGAGCTSGDGTKTVYVKFKNDVGESTKVYDSIILDTVKPTLLTAVYTDVGSGGTVNLSDTIVFTFDDEMLTSTVTASTVATNLLLSNSKTYGTSPTVSWDSTLKICTVTLGTLPTLVVGTTTVNPSASVTDTAGNADNSSAVTISGTTTTVLSSVSISPATATATVGTAMSQSFTASALSTAATTMTSSCTFTWSISPTSGRGTLSATSGTTVTYTFPTGGTEGTATITVSAIKTGTTTPVKTDTSTVTVSAAATPGADATKLSVSAQNNTAIYTDVPSGGSVSVYANSTEDLSAAVTAGSIFTIETSGSPTPITQGKSLGDDDYIYFKVTASDLSSSAVTSDGYIPAEPNATALKSIQATSNANVSSPILGAGNVQAGEKIKCYVDSASRSTATTVGPTMAISPVFTAGDDPTYTRTNAAGHESVVSAADGKILILHNATAVNVADANSLAEGDKVVLTFWDGSNNVDIHVTLPITVSHLTWSSSGNSSLGTGDLATAVYADSAVLTATSAVVDFADSAEKITFNILVTIPITDSAGGNYVLPWVSDSAAHFDSADF